MSEIRGVFCGSVILLYFDITDNIRLHGKYRSAYGYVRGFAVIVSVMMQIISIKYNFSKSRYHTAHCFCIDRCTVLFSYRQYNGVG